MTAPTVRRRRSSDLPDFPWDTLAAAKARAQAHPDGIVDLSVGTPVDPTPEIGQRALAEAADSPGYPLTAGTAGAARPPSRLPEPTAGARAGLAPEATLPVIGTKELVAWLPTLLGLGPGDLVVFPTVAYPTYEVGAPLAGCRRVAADDPTSWASARPALVWLNSPSNPTGADPRRRPSCAAGSTGPASAGRWSPSDECYGEFGWDAEPVSVLHPTSPAAAGRRCSPCTRCPSAPTWPATGPASSPATPSVVAELLAVRKHAGMIVPRPVQEAMIACCSATRTTSRSSGSATCAAGALLRPGAGGRRLPDRALGRLDLPVGHPGRGRPGLGRGPRRPRHPGRARGLLRRGRDPARPGRPDRHRRAGRGRRLPARRSLAGCGSR